MRIKSIKVEVFLFVIAIWQVTAVNSFGNTDSLLSVLDQTIAGQNRFIEEKNRRIQVLINNLGSGRLLPPLEEFEICQSLFLEYRSFQYDSAFKYVLRQITAADRLSDHSRVARAKLNLTFVLGSSGKYKEAFDTLRTIHPLSLSDDLIIDYYEQMGRAYYDLSAYNNDNYYTFITGDMGNAYIDSAIQLCRPNTLQFYRLSGLKAQATGNHRDAISIFQTIIDKFDIDLHQYAMAAYSLGKINQALNNHDEYIDMIIRSAIADIKSCTKENLSTRELAGYMYDAGDIDRASVYIHQAARDAEFYGARQRMLQVSSLLQVIDNTSITNARYRSNRLMYILLMVSIGALVIVSFAVILFRQYQKLRITKQNLATAYEHLSDLNEKLLEANTIKEEYIGYSFAKDSEYLEKLDKFKQEISQRLTEKKYESIQYTLRLFSLEREKEGLYRKFDEIFLKLFPNFIGYFNSFFDKDTQFKVKDNEPMPTELRIFALIRIGITEHEQIARILGYSVRTIYNYKNKVKSASLLPNEEFESALMKVKTFE